MQRFVRWLTGAVALVAIGLLGLFGTSAEVRWAVPGAIALGLWALLTCWSGWVDGSARFAARLPSLAVLFASLYLAWRIGTSAGWRGSGRDLLLLLIGLSGWALGSNASTRRGDGGAALIGFGLLLVANLATAGMQASGRGWHPLEGFGSGPGEGSLLRIRGLFAHYIFFGNLMAMAGTGAIAWAGWSGAEPARRWTLAGAGVLCQLAALATWSRGTMLVVVAADFFLVLFWLAGWRGMGRLWRLVALPVVAASCLLGVLLLLGNRGFAERMSEATQRDLELTLAGEDIRVQVWNGAVDSWLQRPWVGHGAQSTDWNYNRTWPDDLGQWIGRPQFAHQEYLQLLVDYGAIGLAFGLATLAIHLGHGLASITCPRFPNGQGGRSSRAFAAAGAGIVLATCIHALTDFPLHIPVNVAVFGFGLGLLATEPDRLPLSRKPLGAPLLALTAAVSCLVVAALSLPGWFGWLHATREHHRIIQAEANRSQAGSQAFWAMAGMPATERNEDDWMRMTWYAVMASMPQRAESGDWGLRALMTSREARRLNPEDPAALLWQTRCALALNQLGEAQLVAETGWRGFRARHQRYPFHVHLAEVEVSRAQGAAQSGDRLAACRHGLEAIGWLGLGQGWAHLSPQVHAHYRALQAEAESFILETSPPAPVVPSSTL